MRLRIESVEFRDAMVDKLLVVMLMIQIVLAHLGILISSWSKRQS
jgi:hypothetical protein